MNLNPHITQRLISLAMAALLTLGMLGGIDWIAQTEVHPAALLAAHSAPQA